MFQGTSRSEDEDLILLTEEVEQMRHAPGTFRGELILYARELMSAFERCGFTNVREVRADTASSGPHYAAVYGGRNCYICLQNEVSNYVGLSPISNDQCDACDVSNTRRDVYYSALLEESGKLYLYRPVRLKVKGRWLGEDKALEQYFTLGKCSRLTRFRALLGGFSEYKLAHFYIPLVREGGLMASTSIKGLGSLREPPLALVCRMMFPHLCLLTTQEEDKPPEVTRAFFYYEHRTYTELELIRRVGDEPTCGWVELMTAHGSMLYAESMDAAALPTKLRMPLRYTWSLSMVAERIALLPSPVTANSEAFFEIVRAEYRQEHGKELPGSYGENVSSEDFLHLYQVKERPRTMLIGRIVALATEKIFMQMHTVATVKVIENGDEIMLKLIISPELLSDYAPDVGNVISTSGVLQAVPSEALHNRVLWHTAPALGGKKQVTQDWDNAREMYESSAPYSIGAAVAAAAFVAANWTVEANIERNNFARTVPTIVAMNRPGKCLLVLQDTIINGHKPDFPFIGYVDEMRKYVRAKYTLDASVCHAYVMLDFVPEYNHYRVNMKLEPAIPGVRNNISIVDCPLRNGNPFLPKPLDHVNLQRLDEVMAAKLMRRAFERGKWHEFAPWLREELVYTTETTRIARYVGKVDFLRYICERIAGWKRGGAWRRLSFSTGTVPVDGVQRPAFALHDQGEVANLTIFGNSYGMIGSMRSLPASFFPLYEAKNLPQ